MQLPSYGGTPAPDLAEWIAGQARLSADAMERAISATHLTRRRDAFGQAVTPAAGSVLASPEVADWDPEPDYFFHWIRDSAIVMRTVADLMADAPDGGERRRWRRHFEDYVAFSLGLADLDGAAFLRESRHRESTREDYRRHLRPDAEIESLSGDGLPGEPRFNADGTLDFLRWSRPQYDGPALRTLSCLAYLAAGGDPSEPVRRLLRQDLDFTLRHADAPCIGPWEEAGEVGHHYYVSLVQLGALVHGRVWAATDKGGYEKAEERLRAGLDSHWLAAHGVYKAIREATAPSGDDLIDAAVPLAVLDADLPDGPHSVFDPRVRATQAALEAMFSREMPINHALPAGRAPALGRSRGDRYFGGGAWYPTTLAAAALSYRLAGSGGDLRDSHIQRGDAFMATVRALTPADGSLSEQVDRLTGRPTSARHLTWSYAAFVNAARLRAQALGLGP
ncbi:glycoside hydrolase family 15 protein [Shumkonia mesophila]|uniref:glycoside hydrolase family 15 protein n=1 Tax=Shumkonia mesophila TaxID=2838854 RepID=UPI00293428E6|nr:glycoside hydrolase family 15 protein [Shumkonia mesophila]